MDINSRLILVGVLSMLLLILQAGNTLASQNKRSSIDTKITPSPEPMIYAISDTR